LIGIDIGKNSFHVVGHDKRGTSGPHRRMLLPFKTIPWNDPPGSDERPSVMSRLSLLCFVASLLGTISLIRVAVSGADDYVFEAVKEDFKASNVATVAVRLVHKPTGKPVTNAVIVHARIDMSPDGMADMVPVIVPLPTREPGVYAFRSPLTMTGRWLLSITAKVQGEPEAVAGKVIFRATP
jgi:hypothetical protein